jgi:hypothetical protein
VKATGKRSLSKLLACLFAALLVSALIHADCIRVGPKLRKTNARQSDFTNGEGGILCPQNS